MNLLTRVLCLLLAVILSVPALAADGQADTAKPPAGGGYIVLVALHAERNRINEAKRRGDEKLLATLEKDAEETRKRTIMDFTDNFHSYPVYFIMDTDIAKIAKGKKDEVLLNADGSKVKGVPPSLAGGSFVIAYFTHPDLQYIFEDVVVDSERWVKQPRFSNYSLVLYNSKFQQFNFYARRAFAKVKPEQEKYYYKSTVCDMEYFPMANRMEAKRGKRRGITSFFGF